MKTKRMKPVLAWAVVTPAGDLAFSYFDQAEVHKHKVGIHYCSKSERIARVRIEEVRKELCGEAVKLLLETLGHK